MRDRHEIIEEVRQFRLQSQKNQEHYPDAAGKRMGVSHTSPEEELGEDSLCPSGEFVDALLRKCAQEFGVTQRSQETGREPGEPQGVRKTSTTSAG